MEYLNIELGYKEEVSVIKLSRPEKDNKLTDDMMHEINHAIKKAEVSEDCKAIVLSGCPGIFCGGGELGDFTQADASEIVEFGDRLAELCKRIAECPKLVVAAIDGDVVGGGLSLVSYCDLAVCTKSSIFTLPEMDEGIAPMMSLMSLRNDFTRKQCMEAVLFSKEIDAENAKKMGIVNEICEEGDVVKFAFNYIRPILDKNLSAFTLCKRFYNVTDKMAYDKQLETGKYFLVSMLK